MTLLAAGRLQFDQFPDVLQVIIASAAELTTQSKSPQITNDHLLSSLLEHADDAQLSALQSGLKAGAGVQHFKAVLQQHLAPRRLSINPKNLSFALGDYSEHAQQSLALLDSFVQTTVEGVVGSPLAPDALTAAHLWAAVMAYPEVDTEEDASPILDFELAKLAMLKLASPEELAPIPDLFDESNEGNLLMTYFDDTVIEILGRAAEKAGEMGYRQVMPAHLFVALVAQPDGVGAWLVRREAKLSVTPVKVIEEVENNTRLGVASKPQTLDLTRGGLSTRVQRGLEDAFRRTQSTGREAIDQTALMYGVLIQERSGRLADILKQPGLEIDLQKMLRHLDEYAQQMATIQANPHTAPMQLPKSIARSEDLTFLAQNGRLPPLVSIDFPGARGSALLGTSEKRLTSPIEQVKRGLHKRGNNHILITGPAGVGKTTLVRELAWQIANGRIPYLARKKVLWIDCSDIAPEVSRDKLEAIIAAVKGRNDVITCIDGLDAVLRYIGQRESNNAWLLKSALQNHQLNLIAIIEDRYFNELLASDYAMLKLFTRVELSEPDKETTLRILNQLRPVLEQTYKVRIEKSAVQKAVILARDFILSEQLPTKAIEVLNDSCDQARYEFESGAEGGQATVTDAHVIATVAQRTGVPESTLRGSGDEADFEAILDRSIIGQARAVKIAADELKLIKSGDKKSTKPASIMLFAGLTGTGKTELAKTIAQVYSTGKKLTVYTMGNFNESHSVSGIVGVPPGYVGYEMGGRLINELNADPYSVVLFDEVEKAHPDIWKPFLNLFDEGWIVDSRNVKAYGNRAIFILTTNIGAAQIAEMMGRNASMEEIAEAVKAEMYRAVHPTAHQLCFTPEFIARITRIVTFSALSRDAMEGIARLQLGQLTQEWHERHGKELDVHPSVIKRIGEMSHEDDFNSGWKEGGRIVQKHILAHILPQLSDLRRTQEYKDATKIALTVDKSGKFVHRIVETRPLTPEVLWEGALIRIQNLLQQGSPSVGLIARVVTILDEVCPQLEPSGTEQSVLAEINELREQFAALHQEFAARESAFNDELSVQLDSLWGTLSQTVEGSR